jgi:hypothetical protein
MSARPKRWASIACAGALAWGAPAYSFASSAMASSGGSGIGIGVTANSSNASGRSSFWPSATATWSNAAAKFLYHGLIWMWSSTTLPQTGG